MTYVNFINWVLGRMFLENKADKVNGRKEVFLIIPLIYIYICNDPWRMNTEFLMAINEAWANIRLHYELNHKQGICIVPPTVSVHTYNRVFLNKKKIIRLISD